MKNLGVPSIVLVLLLLLSYNIHAQAPDTVWTRTFGSTNYDDCGYSVQQTSDDGYIIVGCRESYNSNKDVYLIKTDSSGNLEWELWMGDAGLQEGKSVQQTSDGGYIITGYTQSSGVSSDVWLIKIDSSGNLEWDETFGGSGTSQGSNSVQQTNDGGYIITGYTTQSIGGLCDVWLIKTDSSGNLEWDETFGSTNNDGGHSVQQTNDGGYIITGMTSYLGWMHMWLIKTDASGILEWDETFGGIGTSHVGRSVQQTSDGGYIITGWSNITSTYVWLIKTDASGNLEWDETYCNGYGYGYSVQQTNDDGYIITGSTSSGSWSDLYLIKTDSSGNLEWDETFGGSYHEVGYSVQQTSDGGYIITGLTGCPDSQDVLLIKTEPYTSIEESYNTDLNALIWLSENPVGGSATLYFELAEESLTSIDIFDLSGRRTTNLLEGVLDSGEHQCQIGNLIPGMYLVQLVTPSYRESLKLLIME